jgi:hypothetical protein
MSRRVFYMYGNVSTGGTTTTYGNYRFFLCDTSSDLPTSGIVDSDFAVVGDSKKFYFGYNSQWNEVKGEKGAQGEPGNIKDAWPVNSIFQCKDETDPEKLLGFGKWECVQKEPWYTWQRKE